MSYPTIVLPPSVNSAPQFFNIKQNSNVFNSNRAPPARLTRIIKTDMGATGTYIPASVVLGQTVIISPSSALQTYTLPTATSIISEFGEPQGVPKLSTGNILPINIINRGTFDAFINGSTGSDGSAVVALCPANTTNTATGTTTMLGTNCSVFIEFTNVASSLSYGGCTGAYTIYSRKKNFNGI